MVTQFQQIFIRNYLLVVLEVVLAKVNEFLRIDELPALREEGRQRVLKELLHLLLLLLLKETLLDQFIRNRAFGSGREIIVVVVLELLALRVFLLLLELVPVF